MLSTTGATLESPAPAKRRGSRRLLALGERSDRVRLADWAVVAGPALLGLALCLYQITTRSLWLDESATVAISSQHGAAFGAALAHDGGNMLAYYALLHVLIGWFGSGSLVLRLPAAVAAAATTALVGLVALRLASRRVALVAGVLSAVSLSLVYWGQDARGYALMIALIVASFLALIALLEGRGWLAWIAYVAVTIAAIYLGLEAVLVVPAQLLALVWFRHRWRRVLSAMAVTAVCCIPLAVLAAQRGAGQLFWVPGPSLRVLKQIVQALTSSGLQPSFYTSTSTALLVLTIIVLVVGALRTSLVTQPAWQPGLVVAWLLVPAIVALIESAVGQSIFQARYLLVSLPAVSLLLGVTLGNRGLFATGRFPGLLSLAAIGALIALRALQLAPAYGVSTENWRGATSYVIARTQARDCIAFYPLDGRMAFRYYLRDFRRAPRPILPTLPWTRVRSFIEDYSSLPSAQLMALPRQCGRVWLIARRGGGAGGTVVSHANRVRFRQLMSGLADHYPVSRTSSYGQADLVTVTLYSR